MNSDCFRTTNRDYGEFYDKKNEKSKEIELELAMNDFVRFERRKFRPIAYEILFDKNDSFRIVSNDKINVKPIVARQQLKFLPVESRTTDERKTLIDEALKIYSSVVQCVFKRNSTEKISMFMSKLIANELLFLHPEFNADELADAVAAMTIDRSFRQIPSIDPDRSYPGDRVDCQRLAEKIDFAQMKIDETEQFFDRNKINCVSIDGLRYVFNPFAKRNF